MLTQVTTSWWKSLRSESESCKVAESCPTLPPHGLYQFSSVAQSCLTLCDPMNHSMPGLPVHHQLPEFIKLMCIKSVMPSSHLILCRPLLLLPPIPSSIRVFSSESTLRVRWPKYWSFSFSSSPSNEHPGLVSFSMDCSMPDSSALHCLLEFAQIHIH